MSNNVSNSLISNLEMPLMKDIGEDLSRGELSAARPEMKLLTSLLNEQDGVNPHHRPHDSPPIHHHCHGHEGKGHHKHDSVGKLERALERNITKQLDDGVNPDKPELREEMGLLTELLNLYPQNPRTQRG